MKIPKRFKLFGETINIIISNELESRRDRLGEAHFKYNEIIISDNKKMPKAIMDITFWHEFVHIALNRMKRDELEDDEAFVNILAQLIHQAVETMEY